MINRALEALSHARVEGYLHRIPSAMDDSNELQSLARDFSISAVERRLDQAWMVMIHFPGGPANRVRDTQETVGSMLTIA